MFWNQSLIAIDIGSSSVKLCELSRTGKALKQIAYQVFPTLAVVDGEIREPEVVREIILDMLKKAKIQTKGRRASVAINGSGIILKRAIVTPEHGDVFEPAAQEASQLFQADSDDLYLRFAPLGRPYKDGRVPMVLVGARRDLVEQYIGLIRSVGLRTGVVDCGPLAIANMFDYNYPVKDVLITLVNVGATTTQVIVLHNGEYYYSRDVAIGGSDYNKKIMERAGVDEENAESLKFSASSGGGQVQEEVLEAINDINELMSSEIVTTLNFFFENEDFPKEINRQGFVFLVGGGARTLGLDATLAANLQMPVQIANPFQRIDHRSSGYDLQYILNQGSLYGAVLGLAMRKYQDHQGN